MIINFRRHQLAKRKIKNIFDCIETISNNTVDQFNLFENIIKLSQFRQMIQCHYCSQPFEKVDLSSIAKCCIKRCNKYYCVECIKKHFNPEFDMQMYRKDTWICYSCQNFCPCDKCKKPQKPQKAQKPQKQQKSEQPNDKKPAKKKGGKPKGNGDQSIELSISNMSQNNIKSEGANLPNLQQQENVMVDEEEQQVIQDQPMPQFKLYTEDQMYQFAPFYRKIAERRNQFYNFILKEWRRKKLISKHKQTDKPQQKNNCEVDRNE